MIREGDSVVGKDGVSITSKIYVKEDFQENAYWTIRKFANETDHQNDNPYEVARFKDNLLVNDKKI